MHKYTQQKTTFKAPEHEVHVSRHEIHYDLCSSTELTLMYTQICGPPTQYDLSSSTEVILIYTQIYGPQTCGCFLLSLLQFLCQANVLPHHQSHFFQASFGLFRSLLVLKLHCTSTANVNVHTQKGGGKENANEDIDTKMSRHCKQRHPQSITCSSNDPTERSQARTESCLVFAQYLHL